MREPSTHVAVLAATLVVAACVLRYRRRKIPPGDCAAAQSTSFWQQLEEFTDAFFCGAAKTSIGKAELHVLFDFDALLFVPSIPYAKKQVAKT